MSLKSNPVDLHVGQKLRGLRLAENLSQETLANLTGLTIRDLEDRESGRVRLTTQELTDLAAFFSISPCRFFEGFAAVARLDGLKARIWGMASLPRLKVRKTGSPLNDNYYEMARALGSLEFAD
ncbi:helix-turn-helix domain-containing protein [Rhodovibrionaceae bacterium A322]